MRPIRISESAIVEKSTIVGEGTSVWHNTQIRGETVIGNDCIIGKDVYIGSGVKIGNNCKIQNGAQIYEPAILGDGIFIGPQVVLTNDRIPRAINPDESLKSTSDWKPVGVVIEEGASVGANSTCVAPLRIGKWAMIGAGSVVLRDVPNYALVVGNPARQIGWVDESGVRLVHERDDFFESRTSGSIFQFIDGELRKVSK
jgi:UDP-2-acetamido-3-amino-2,3-dideoxy-glucuronate N-acetyltransferase